MTTDSVMKQTLFLTDLLNNHQGLIMQPFIMLKSSINPSINSYVTGMNATSLFWLTRQVSMMNMKGI